MENSGEVRGIAANLCFFNISYPLLPYFLFNKVVIPTKSLDEARRKVLSPLGSAFSSLIGNFFTCYTPADPELKRQEPPVKMHTGGQYPPQFGNRGEVKGNTPRNYITIIKFAGETPCSILKAVFPTNSSRSKATGRFPSGIEVRSVIVTPNCWGDRTEQDPTIPLELFSYLRWFWERRPAIFRAASG
jgi:hypothetical protein